MKNRVRIIAPASKRRSNSEAILQKGIELLEKSGFIVSVQENIFGEVSPNFYANTKDARLEGLRSAILDEEIDIIIAFRGGYGCGEIADECMDIKPAGDKILIGFSDLTYLHVLFNQYYKIPSIHGSVITSLVEKHPENIEEIKSILSGKEQSLALKPLNEAAGSDISGIITGGNLTIITTMIGTELQPNLEGKILLLEEVYEPGYRISRLFNHLEKAGMLEGLKGIILGDFTEGDEYTSESINSFVDSQNDLPIYSMDGIGHGDVNHPILLGKEAKIEDNILKFSL